MPPSLLVGPARLATGVQGSVTEGITTMPRSFSKPSASRVGAASRLVTFSSAQATWSPPTGISMGRASRAKALESSGRTSKRNSSSVLPMSSFSLASMERLTASTGPAATTCTSVDCSSALKSAVMTGSPAMVTVMGISRSPSMLKRPLTVTPTTTRPRSNLRLSGSRCQV